MDVLIERGAGLDVHQASVVATVRYPGTLGRESVTVTFGAMAADLLALREWLQAYGVTHVALESTGVYWKPVYYMLEEGFTLLLINMQTLKLPELRRALAGRFRRHHAFLVEQILAKIDYLDETLERLHGEIDARLAPFEPMLTALDTIPGVDRIAAISIVAETGGDMSRFPSAGHVCSWAALCPGRTKGRGNGAAARPARATAIFGASSFRGRWGASHSKGTALQARYHRVKRHRGHKKAVVAVAHQILEIAYFIMRDGVTYQELGADYFDRRHAERAVRRHVRQLEALGFHVTIDKAA
jgi:transposase